MRSRREIKGDTFGIGKPAANADMLEILGELRIFTSDPFDKKLQYNDDSERLKYMKITLAKAEESYEQQGDLTHITSQDIEDLRAIVSVFEIREQLADLNASLHSRDYTALGQARRLYAQLQSYPSKFRDKDYLERGGNFLDYLSDEKDLINRIESFFDFFFTDLISKIPEEHREELSAKIDYLSEERVKADKLVVFFEIVKFLHESGTPYLIEASELAEDKVHDLCSLMLESQKLLKEDLSESHGLSNLSNEIAYIFQLLKMNLLRDLPAGEPRMKVILDRQAELEPVLKYRIGIGDRELMQRAEFLKKSKDDKIEKTGRQSIRIMEMVISGGLKIPSGQEFIWKKCIHEAAWCVIAIPELSRVLSASLSSKGIAFNLQDLNKENLGEWLEQVFQQLSI